MSPYGNTWLQSVDAQNAMSYLEMPSSIVNGEQKVFGCQYNQKNLAEDMSNSDSVVDTVPADR